MKSILDPSFAYVPAVRTDIRKTFQRVRRELRAQAELQKQQAQHTVVQFNTVKGSK